MIFVREHDLQYHTLNTVRFYLSFAFCTIAMVKNVGKNVGQM